MTDTPRTIAALQGLFADNNTGDISAQNLRDFLVTVVNYLDGVVMTPDDPTTVALTVNMPTGADFEGTSGLIINADPDVDNSGNPFVDFGNFDISILGPADRDPAFNMNESDGNGGISIGPAQGITVRPSEANAAAIFLKWATGTTPDALNGALLSAQGDQAGSKIGDVKITAGGYLVVARNSVPADAALAAGDLALWFDSTNGAAKLMLKGKSANGTVVTGNVALS